MSTIENASRRGFLKGMVGTGALILAVRFTPGLELAPGADGHTDADRMPFHPNVFLGIETDGTVHIVAHRSEMGTAIRTSLPLVVAEELDADWKRVVIDQAIGDPRYGEQNTDGSRSIRNFYNTMRECGASARWMLIQAAAQQWNVPPSECTTAEHAVFHSKSVRKAGYGELASAAAKLEPPTKDQLQFKKPPEWRYVGKGHTSYDLQHLCNGTAIYGMDARLDGMIYASIEHPPVFGGKAKSFDDQETVKVRGVKQTVLIDPFKPPAAFQPLGGVAVLADNTWAAFQGRKKLKVTWENGPNETYDSAPYKDGLLETARKPAKVIRSVGDANSAIAAAPASNVVEAEYYVPLLAHAPMEPMVALAEYKDGKVTAWAPTQNPQAVQAIISSELGIPKENVICNVTLLGGGFGRKSKPDYVAEAAVLAKKTGRPVKVVWTREDDIKFDYYNAVAGMYFKAAVDAKGKPTAWLQRCAFPPITSIFDVEQVYGDPPHLAQGWTDMPYDLPNISIENGPAKAHVRIGWLRSVANIYHGFGIQGFTDELAHRAKRDPVEYLLDLIGEPRTIDFTGVNNPNYGADYKVFPWQTGRLRHVTEMVAEKSGWANKKNSKGHGFGIATHRSFLTYVATVVEVEVNDQGEIRIPRVDTVLDAGLVVNPEITRAQFEGAAVFGTSIVRSGEITAKNGVIQQSNFDDYPVARITEAPRQTNVYIVESSGPPTGVGEPGVPPFVAALCNAISAATGKRIRNLPLSSNPISA